MIAQYFRKKSLKFFLCFLLPSSPVGKNHSLVMFSKGCKLFQSIRTTEIIDIIKIVDIMGRINECNQLLDSSEIYLQVHLPT